MADDDVEIPVTELPPDDAVPHLWPAELDADYALSGELGRGGMAVVFRARDRELSREVAVKVVRPRFAADEEAVARLAREARTVAQLEHPNIVGVYSIRHLSDRSVALVMQLIPGRTLKQAITEDGPFDGARAEQVLRDVARALAYAHRAGVVHRDVKPENIFLDATSGRAMLSDFGVARVMDAPTELTATGTTIGTPTYMAPEQIDGVNLDGRSDLYSLGMVGWEMLTGERPWAGESLYSVIYRQKHDQLPPIDSFRDDIPPRTQYLIEGLMPKNPDRRWASAARFLTLLASDQPLPGYKEWESAQRRRRRTRLFQRARQRGDSVIEAALETVKFSRPPTPVAPLAQDPARKTPAPPAPPAPAPEERFFEPTGEAARKATPATLPRAAAPSALARGTPSGGFSIQRPPHEANIRLSQGGVTVAPPRSRLVRASVFTVALAVAVLAWIQFGPARAAEPKPIDFPDVTRDDRAIDVPVVPPVDSARLRSTDSAIAASLDSAAALPHTLIPALGQPNARLRGVRPGADSSRLAAAPPPSTTRSAPRQDSAAGGVLVAPAPVIPAAPMVPTLNFPRDAGTISAGRGHSCALGNDGRAACWGSNDNGQLGDGSLDMRPKPTFIAGDFTFAQISAGLNHTCGLTTGSEVVCWGMNTNGQLGDGTTQSRNAPVRLNSTVSFRLVSAGRDHTCGLSNSRTVWCWGSNTDGQLGDGSRQRRNSPVMADLPGSVAALAVGWTHTCALTADGVAWCWGNNDSGQLGDGSTASRPSPTRVSFDGQFVSITGGAAHSCGVAATSGEAWCWGRNGNGQLGSGSTVNAPTPHLVSGAGPFSTITAGGYFTCARGRDSSAWCWGANNFGQLGDGTTLARSVPVQVKGLGARLASLNSGGAHTCAVTERGETYCWGMNTDGQVGRGDRDEVWSPIRVLVPPR
jgi:serine/threonine protein kinase/alpha-tubulin suppressor-like RCC1 family protein